MNEVIVRYMEMPPTIRGVTAEDADGDYNIYLNSNLPEETQIEALNHELTHIVLCHFDRGEKSAEERENEVDKSKEATIGELEHTG